MKYLNECDDFYKEDSNLIEESEKTLENFYQKIHPEFTFLSASIGSNGWDDWEIYLTTTFKVILADGKEGEGLAEWSVYGYYGDEFISWDPNPDRIDKIVYQGGRWYQLEEGEKPLDNAMKHDLKDDVIKLYQEELRNKEEELNRLDKKLSDQRLEINNLIRSNDELRKQLKWSIGCSLI